MYLLVSSNYLCFKHVSFSYPGLAQSFVGTRFTNALSGVIAIGWQAYLSVLNQRAAKMEHDTHEIQQRVETAEAITSGASK